MILKEAITFVIKLKNNNKEFKGGRMNQKVEITAFKFKLSAEKKI